MFLYVFMEFVKVVLSAYLGGYFVSRLQLALIDQSQYENVVSAMRRELAGFESSECRPKIKIHPNSIEFGKVK